MKVVLYEPFGNGGICHYTHQLLEGLGRLGPELTLLTTDPDDIQHVPESVQVCRHLAASQMYGFVRRAVARIRGRANGQRSVAGAPNGGSIAQVSGTNGRRAGWIEAVRRWVIWLEVLAHWARERPDIVHIQWLLYPNEDRWFLNLVRALGIKVVYTAHNLLPHDRETPDERRVYGKIYQLADRVIVHAEHLRQEMVREFPIDPKRIAVIPIGSYDMFFRDVDFDKEKARKALGIDGERKVILFFGAVRPYKGVLTLLDAFGEVRQSIPGAMLLIVGKSGEQDGELRQAILTKAQQYDAHVVQWRNEYVPMDMVPWYFVACDIVVLPYVRTSQSAVLFMAYAAGRPVVVTDTGGLTEAVEGCQTGLVVPPGDSAALAKALTECLSDQEHLEAMGRHAKRLAETTYAWPSIALKTISVYESLLNNSFHNQCREEIHDHGRSASVERESSHTRFGNPKSLC